VKLKLAEHFMSVQGEGHLTGKPTYFIRFAGCAVATCPLHPSNLDLCDTDWSPKEVITNLRQLAQHAAHQVGLMGWVTITGGEPMDQPEALGELVAEFKKARVLVNIQTSGTRWVTCPWDWLSVSPKCKADDLVQTFGQEMKVVVYPDTDQAELAKFYARTRFWNYYLMPLWNQGHDIPHVLSVLDQANRGGDQWELTTQAHKWWNVR
jgi:organic radical activating enzyme